MNNHPLTLSMALSSNQLGVLFLLAFSFIVSLAGFVAPYWQYRDLLNPDGPDVKLTVGLFYACASVPARSYDGCVSVPWELGHHDGDGTYFKVVRVLMGVTMACQVITLLVSVITCWYRTSANDIAFECTMSIVAGVVGLAGTATYANHSGADYHPFRDTLPLHKDNIHLITGFAFYLSCAGSASALVTGLLGLCVPRWEKTKTVQISRVRGLTNPSYSMEPTMKAAY